MTLANMKLLPLLDEYRNAIDREKDAAMAYVANGTSDPIPSMRERLAVENRLWTALYSIDNEDTMTANDHNLEHCRACDKPIARIDGSPEYCNEHGEMFCCESCLENDNERRHEALIAQVESQADERAMRAWEMKQP